MGSVQEYVKCPDCSGVTFVDYYWKSGEEYSRCQRCGVSESHTLKRDEDKTVMKDAEGKFMYDHKRSEGFGIYGIFDANSGVGQVGTFGDRITDETIEEFRQIFAREDVDKEKSYLARWEDGKQTLLLGTQLSDMNSMDFDDLMEKWKRDNEDYGKAVHVKGLGHLTKDELLDIVNGYLKDKLNFVDDDFKITQISLVGSRLKGTNREDSDLDIAFEYEGKYREDSMCDTLNGEPLMIDDMRVDFIPYAQYKGNHIMNHAPIEHLLYTNESVDVDELLGL
jgi:predicted nucleotidyltransferase